MNTRPARFACGSTGVRPRGRPRSASGSLKKGESQLCKILQFALKYESQSVGRPWTEEATGRNCWTLRWTGTSDSASAPRSGAWRWIVRISNVEWPTWAPIAAPPSGPGLSKVQDGQEKTCQLCYGVERIRLAGRDEPMHLVVVAGFGQDLILLLTNALEGAPDSHSL